MVDWSFPNDQYSNSRVDKDTVCEGRRESRWALTILGLIDLAWHFSRAHGARELQARTARVIVIEGISLFGVDSTLQLGREEDKALGGEESGS